MKVDRSLLIQKGKEVEVENHARQVHHNIVDMPMLGEVFTYAEYRNRKAEPRNLKAEKHDQNHIQDGNSTSNIIPFEAVSGFDAEPIF